MSRREHLVIAATQVLNSSKACRERGDAAMFDTLTAYYAILHKHALTAHGRVIKAVGDGVLLTFPVAHVGDAIASLRAAQTEANALWRQFFDECSVQVKVSDGEVVCGELFGRFDIVGDAVNRLFKPPWDDFLVTSTLDVSHRDR